MRMLYYDRWVDVPAPGIESGGVQIRVSHACSAGQQGNVRARLSKVEKAEAILRQSPRLVRSTLRHLRTYGIQRTLQSVRSHTSNQHLASAKTCSSFCGRPLTDDTGQTAPLVAGYRHDGALFAEVLVAHPEQMAPLPEGLREEDAATVLYYAIALATLERLERWPASVVVLSGRALHCLILRDLLEQQGRSVLTPSTDDPAAMRLAAEVLDAGAPLVLGHSGYWAGFERWMNRQQTLHAGTHADQLTAGEWLELEERWIGLPHAEVRNLHILSGLPLEIAPAFLAAGLKRALWHMLQSERRPSAHTQSFSAAHAHAGDVVDLSRPRLFTMPVTAPLRARPAPRVAAAGRDSQLRVAAVGMGNWGTETLFPLINRHPRARIALAVDRNPVQLLYGAELLKIPAIAANVSDALEDPNIDALFIATRHDNHAELAARALAAGKSVFLEKPLALDYDQLTLLADAVAAAPKQILAAGLNRPHWRWTPWLRQRIAEVPGPVTISAIVREIRIHRTHYYNWPHMGTRIVSNGCHWIDLAHHLLGGRRPVSVQAVVGTDDKERAHANNAIVVRYEDGSCANLVFSDSGDTRQLVHEYIDIKTQRSHFMIDDFCRLTEFRDGNRLEIWSGKAERGWAQCVGSAIDSMLDGGPPPRPFAELAMSASLTLEARASFLDGGSVRKIAAPTSPGRPAVAGGPRSSGKAPRA